MADTYQLEDRYTADRGRVLLTGIQALARLPIEQLRADRRRGLHTAAFLSGYPGSPLGGYDLELARAIRLAGDLPIVHQPGLNEEYAATAVMGSQLAAARPDARYEGVVGFWYGKSPGVDRAADALRHAVYAGTAPKSGAVALVGDDPNAKSSTIPSSSAGVLADLHLPLLYPADPGEALDLGRHAVALSRSTGLWAALKLVSEVADGCASVELDPDRVQPILIEREWELRVRLPEARLLAPRSLEIERDIFEVRYARAVEYAAANALNETTVTAENAWIGILASGFTYREVREALSRLGLHNEREIAACGIRLYRMRMPIPFDPHGVHAFASGLEELFIVEEKQPNLETLVKDALYGMSAAPRIVGKRDERGRPLLPGYGSLDADEIARALRPRLSARLGDRLAPLLPAQPTLPSVSTVRTPYYCSGCPHNRSTPVPDGALVGIGVGCSTMAMLMDPERFGEASAITCMGNEGTHWIGLAPFVDTPHFIQNLGDGTYFHSGQLAITAAVSAGVRMTFKLLYNRGVAMTGGQLPPGQIGVPEIAANLLNQGVAQVLITTDDPSRYRGTRLPRGVEVWSRERMDEAQRMLASVDGVTVLIHDQACAAETRRLRRRGKAPIPTQRVAINHRVCEGCGDCGRVSNCLSVEPVDTAFGRKTRIEQTSCNLDYSCLEGDCPSFVTVDVRPPRFGRRARNDTDAAPRAAQERAPVALPEPRPIVSTEALDIRLTGIGGTGVVTVAQVIGTAAMLAGFHVRGLDQIGLSQKAGPVVSDLCLRRGEASHSNRVGSGRADVLIALDQLVAVSPKGLSTLRLDHTVVVGSTSSTPTGHMIGDPTIRMPQPDELERVIREAIGTAPAFWADATRITSERLGDAQTANVFVVGMAFQAGVLPIPSKHIERALRLNGVAVEANLAAFRGGREHVAKMLSGGFEPSSSPASAVQLDPELAAAIDALGLEASLRARVGLRAADLIDYQDLALARSYLATLAEVVAAERRVGLEPGRLTDAVASNLHRLVAYKDEYEVARLLTSGDGADEVRRFAQAKGGRVAYRLHPPLLRALGLRRKIAIPGWATPALRLLARGKRLRGTLFDPFGHTALRRDERSLPGEYRAALARVLRELKPDDYDDAMQIAELPDLISGYESLKVKRIAEFRARLPDAG